MSSSSKRHLFKPGVRLRSPRAHSPESATQSATANRLVERSRLIEIIANEQPRLVMCFASAGYGKTVFAKQLAATVPSVFCDCSLAQTMDDFSRVLVRALDDREIAAADGAPPFEIVAAAWFRAAERVEAVVLDNVDGLPAEAFSLLARLFDEAAELTLVICGRSYAKARFAHRLRPTDVLTLSERDLRFDQGETRELFDGALGDATIDRIEQVTHGWPLALQLVARSARLGRLQALLDDPDDIEFQWLHDYIDEHIVATLDPVAMEQLCVVASLETTNVDELSAVLGSDVHATIGAVRSLPMVREEHGRFTVHPLIASYLAHRGGSLRKEALRRSCDALRRRGQGLRAVNVALSGGEPAWVADLFEEDALRLNVPLAVADLAARLDLRALAAHPGLWSVAVTHRAAEMNLDERLAQGLDILRLMPPGISVESVVAVATVVRECLIAGGQWASLAVVDGEVAARLDALDASSDRAALRARTIADARMAAARGMVIDLDRVQGTVGNDSPIATQAGVLAFVAAPFHAARGDRTAERQAFDDAIVRAKRSCVAPLLLECLQSAAVAAWIAGEQELFDDYVAAVEALVEQRPGIHGAARHFLACVRGHGVAAREGTEKPALRAMAWLVAAASTGDSAERRLFLEDALRAADTSGQLRAKVLTRLAAARSGSGAAPLLAEAKKLTGASDDLALRTAIAAPAGGMLGHFLKRFRPSADQPERGSATLRVEVLTGTVVRDGNSIVLSPKEFALLALLGIHTRPVDAEVLVDTLWPNALCKDRKVGLRVYVSRLRKRLGDSRAILVKQQRYTRGDHVSTDLDEIEQFIRELPTIGDGHVTVERAIAYLRLLNAGPTGVLIDLPAFGVLYPRVNENLDRLRAWLDERRIDLPNQLRIAIDHTLDGTYDGAERRRSRRDRRVAG